MINDFWKVKNHSIIMGFVGSEFCIIALLKSRGYLVIREQIKWKNPLKIITICFEIQKNILLISSKNHNDLKDVA